MKYNRIRAHRIWGEEDPGDPYELLDKFLEKRGKTDGGWATFTEEDERLLHDFLHALIHAKFEADSDGDFPLELWFVNRHNEHFIPFPILPYPGNIREREDRREIFDFLNTLAGGAEYFAGELRRYTQGELMDMILEKRKQGENS